MEARLVRCDARHLELKAGNIVIKKIYKFGWREYIVNQAESDAFVHIKMDKSPQI